MIARIAGISGAALTSAAAAVACCLGPALAGVGGVALGGAASVLQPWRPLFLGLSLGFLTLGWWRLRREERRACIPGTACASPARRAQSRWILGVSSVVIVAMLLLL